MGRPFFIHSFCYGYYDRGLYEAMFITHKRRFLMNLQDRITAADLPNGSFISFTAEEGTDVFHFNESHLETALEETLVPERVATAATSGLKLTTEYGHNPLEVLRDADLLEDYERGSFDFEDFVVGAVRGNFWDHELIEESTEKYDHKRGFTTLSTTFKALVEDVTENPAGYESVFSGWKASIGTPMGQLTFEV